jgi:hypothetical protein
MLSQNALDELHDVLESAPDAVEGVLKRLEEGRIEGRWYCAPKGTFVILDKTSHQEYFVYRLQDESRYELQLEYNEDCGCLKGSVALESGCIISEIEVETWLAQHHIYLNWAGELETFIKNIHYNHTPENNVWAKELRQHILDWMNEQ